MMRFIYLSNTRRTFRLFFFQKGNSYQFLSVSYQYYDLILCGFPVQSMGLPAKMEAFVKEIPEGTKVAIFATHGSLRGGELAITAFYAALSLSKHLKVMGTFGCRGVVKQAIVDALLKKAEHRGWALEAQSAMGHPDDADLADTKAFAAAMVTKARAN